MRCILLPLIDEAMWDNLSEEERGREMAAFRAYGGALKEAGALVGNYRPEPSRKAKTVRVAGDEVRVQHGPHADTKEQLGGVYIIDVPDLDAAIEWAARPRRPVWRGRGAADLGPARLTANMARAGRALWPARPAMAGGVLGVQVR